MLPLTEPLVQLVKTGATRAGLRVDALCSFLLVSQIAAVHIKASDILVKEKLWDLLLDTNSTLVSSSLVITFSFLYHHHDCVQSGYVTLTV